MFHVKCEEMAKVNTTTMPYDVPGSKKRSENRCLPEISRQVSIDNMNILENSTSEFNYLYNKLGLDSKDVRYVVLWRG